MSDYKDYSPLASLTKLRGEMQRKIQESGELVIPGTQMAAPLVVEQRAAPCVVLLRMLTENGPVPDDLKGLSSGAAIRDHVRPDGAVYRGSYEVYGQPDSVVLVYADPTTSEDAIQYYVRTERPVLERRYSDWQLGPFAARPA